MKKYWFQILLTVAVIGILVASAASGIDEELLRRAAKTLIVIWVVGVGGSTLRRRKRLDPSRIFENLDIHNFSWHDSGDYGEMACKVTNNNDATVYGYITVTHYDKLKNSVASYNFYLRDVENGETVACSAVTDKGIPYDSVEFSLAELYVR